MTLLGHMAQVVGFLQCGLDSCSRPYLELKDFILLSNWVREASQEWNMLPLECGGVYQAFFPSS